LFVAFFYPPIGGVSVPRTLGVTRHLPDHGWEVTVVTPARSAYHLQDPSLGAHEATGTQVIRTTILEPAAIRRNLVELAARARRRTRGGGAGDDASASPPGGGERLSWLRRLVFFPDDQVLWLPFAVVAAWREHRRRPATAILSSSSPVTAHLIAGLVARLAGVPWVAEFRDPWLGNALAHRAPWFHRQLQRRLERWIVSRAQRCVFVTPSLTRLYRTRYPSLAHRFATVTNAYDLERPSGQDRVAPDVGPTTGARAVTLVYAGTLDRPAELRTFLDGLRAYHAETAGRPTVRVTFLGHVSDACRELVAAADAALGPGVVELEGYVPREIARSRLRTADGALLLLGDGTGMGLFVGGKLFEYLGMDQPIFAMLPAGDARDLLESLPWGTIASPTPSSVAAALERFVAPAERRAIADPERRFERRAVVARLAEVLDEAVAAASPS
jgi:glycosyltransferase involved in cell wall biosynthesis